MISYKLTKKKLSDIQALKKNLMTSDISFENTSNNATLSLRQAINENNGKLLEENVQKALEYNFGFKKLQNSPTFFMKKIRFDKNKEDYEILQNDETTISIDKKKYKILFNKDFELSIKNENNELLGKIESKENNKEKNLILKGTNITLIAQPYKETEIDGFFCITNFSVNQFDKNEVSVIYTNVTTNEENNFKYAIVEVKLSANKVNDLIKNK